MYFNAVREWATPLWTPDTESCVVTWLLPCHVYAKLHLSSYGIHFLSYAFFVLGIRNVYSLLAYYQTYHCPPSKTDQCILVSQEECTHHFMNVNGIDSPCVYYSDLNACVFGKDSCIQVPMSAYSWCGSLLSLFYLCLFCMNYQARKVIRTTYHIESNHECVAATGCSLCGLAQAYREIV